MHAKPTTGGQDYPEKTSGTKPDVSLPVCFHEVLFANRCEPIMRSPANRRLIWWLCIANLRCKLCYKRLGPKFSMEDYHGSKARSKAHGAQTSY